MRTAIVLVDVKYPHNLAAAIRAAACFNVDYVLWTGKRFDFADGERLPREERMKGYRDVTFENTDKPFDWLKKKDSQWWNVCIELLPGAAPLTHYTHPLLLPTAYVFGPEDGHVKKSIRTLCNEFVYIPANHCLNLAAAINVTLSHRIMQRDEPLAPAVHEQRGIIEIPGWESR